MRHLLAAAIDTYELQPPKPGVIPAGPLDLDHTDGPGRMGITIRPPGRSYGREPDVMVASGLEAWSLSELGDIYWHDRGTRFWLGDNSALVAARTPAGRGCRPGRRRVTPCSPAPKAVGRSGPCRHREVRGSGHEPGRDSMPPHVAITGPSGMAKAVAVMHTVRGPSWSVNIFSYCR